MQLDASGLINTTLIPNTQTGSVTVSFKAYTALRDAGMLQPVGSLVGVNFNVSIWSYPLPNNMFQCYLISGETVSATAAV